MDFSKLTQNEAWTLGIAAYAAVVATFVAVWDIYKWAASGSRLKMVIKTNIDRREVDELFIHMKFSIQNDGTQAATILDFALRELPSAWLGLLGGLWDVTQPSSDDYFITTPLEAAEGVIEPGHNWSNEFYGGEHIIEMARKRRLVIVVNSTGKPAKLQRTVVLPKM